MQPRTIQFMAEACGGECRGLNPETLVSRVSTDSRSVQPGDLFVAIHGEKFDGHAFVADCIQRGAIGAVVERSQAGAQPCIAVANTRAALGQMAGAYRRGFDLTAVAVSGSNGKTSTKELLASVLRRGFPTLASSGSFNNDIGVPLTLLEIAPEHRAGIFEAGTNHPGELRPLLERIQPRIGVLASIGREHLEFFGDLDGVLQEEGQIAEALPADGLLVMHGECFGSDKVAARTNARVLRAGFGAGNDWQVLSARLEAGGTAFELRAPSAEFSGSYFTKLLGLHQALNAAYAVIVGAELGLTRAQIQAGLAACAGAKMRLQMRQIGEFTVLDDSYNANADSMAAALDTLSRFPCSGRRIAVLGDMAELGASREPAHVEIGRRAAERGIDLLISVGQNASLTADGARKAGLAHVIVSPQAEAAGPVLREQVRPGDVILVKASRSSRLERVIEHLATGKGQG
jgi:UDP-N-acetylmuramoyl-tripeptide--D-alanyl-D-alanine ligase